MFELCVKPAVRAGLLVWLSGDYLAFVPAAMGVAWRTALEVGQVERDAAVGAAGDGRRNQSWRVREL